MSLDYCQRSPSSLPSSTSPVLQPAPHFALEATSSTASRHQQSPYRTTMTNYDRLGADSGGSAGAETTATTSTPDTRPPRPPKPQPPPRHFPPSSSVAGPSSSSAAVSAPAPELPPKPSTSKSTPSDQTQPTTPRHVPSTSSVAGPSTSSASAPAAGPSSSSASAPAAPEPPRPSSSQSTPSNQTQTTPPQDATTTGSLSHASTSGCSTPPVQRWTRGFNYLIADNDGLKLFREFVKQQTGTEDLIDFHFSCESIRCPENRFYMPRLARAIIRKYILNNPTVVGNLSEEVKADLVQAYKVGTSGKQPLDEDYYRQLFTAAQLEILNILSGSFYEHFIRSNIYLHYLSEITYNTAEQATVYSEAPNAEATPSPRNSVSLESNNNNLEPSASQHHGPSTSFESVPSGSQGGGGGGYNPYGTIEGFRQSFNPDNALPPLAEADETSSNIDGKIDDNDDDEVASAMAITSDKGSTTNADYAHYNYSSDSGISTHVSLASGSMSLERHRSSKSYSNTSNRTRAQSPIVLAASTSTLGRGHFRGSGHSGHSSSSGTSSTLVGDKYHDDHGIKYEGTTLKPEDMQAYFKSRQLQMEHLAGQSSLGSGGGGAYPPNPYYISNFTAIPPSARDSERQSISSNSTASESYGMLHFRDRRLQGQSGAKVGGGSSGLPGTAKLPPNVLRNALERVGSSRQQQQQQGGERSGRNINYPNPTTQPEEFASLLIQRLNAKLEDVARHQRVTQHLRDIEKESDSGSGGNVVEASSSAATGSKGSKGKKDFGQGLKDALKKRQFDFGPPDKEDKDCQSILDKHCAQVFDMTPSNSGTPTTAAAASGSVPVPSVIQNGPYLIDGPPSGGPSQIVRGPFYPPANYRLTNATVRGHHPHPPYDVQRGVYYSRSNQLPPPSPNPGPPFFYNTASTSAAALPGIPVTVKFSDEDCPYKLTIPGPPVTLLAFKKAIPAKRGVFRYFFKRKCNAAEQKENQCDFVQQAIDEDAAELPLCDGKILATAHQH